MQQTLSLYVTVNA